LSAGAEYRRPPSQGWPKLPRSELLIAFSFRFP